MVQLRDTLRECHMGEHSRTTSPAMYHVRDVELEPFPPGQDPDCCIDDTSLPLALSARATLSAILDAMFANLVPPYSREPTRSHRCPPGRGVESGEHPGFRRTYA